LGAGAARLWENLRPSTLVTVVTHTLTDIDPQPSQKLLRECRDLLEHDLCEWIEDLGPIVAREVSDLANATRDNARKTEYLRLLLDLQGRWGTLAAAFREHLAQQQQHADAAETSRRPAADFAHLQLVDDKELTERIVMREFAGRISEACSEETYALDRRIAHLVGCEELDEDHNPFGPHAVCAAVRAGCEAMQADLDNRTLLVRQMERHLQSELPELYRAINEILIKAGILPDLKRSYRPASPSGAPAAKDNANILGTLQRLAQTRQTGMGSEGMATGRATGTGIPGSGAPGAIIDDGAFLQSLQTLQALPAATPGSLVNVVRMARDSDAARQVPPLEAITLDIVAMLFDMIFDDEKADSDTQGGDA
jgi:hypothetical protein